MSRLDSKSAEGWDNAHPVTRWIELADEAPHKHRPLFEAAVDALVSPVQPSQETSLSEACERWRYQLLNHARNRGSRSAQVLVNVLDLAANKLAARPSRLPRRTIEAIAAAGPETIGGRTIDEWFSSDASKQELIQLATQVTVSDGNSAHDTDCISSGRRQVSLFASIYLSNYCVNFCPYCWFRYPEQIERRHLSVDEVVREAVVLAGQGIHDVLLVAGEFPKLVNARYLAELTGEIRKLGLSVRIEVAPLSTLEYRLLVDAGVQGVTLYQETYDRELYARYHPRGPKGKYEYRLETMDRAAEAGIVHLGLGILVGLADPLEEMANLIKHGRYLEHRFPAAKLAFSLPRIHSAPSGFVIPQLVDDETLILLYCLLRVAFPTAQLVLSTRESPALRNRLVPICITRMSAGSRTYPGAYSGGDEASHAGEQFAVADVRSVTEVREWLQTHGCDAD